MGLTPEGESVEGEPTAAEYIAALEDWRELLDEETFLSLTEELNADLEGGLGYLYTVAAENELDAAELLTKYNLIQEG